MINNFNNWVDIFSGTYQSSYQCNKVPIPEIPLIINPTNKILVGCFSQSAPSHWSLAGWIYQIIPLPFKSFVAHKEKCLLNKYNFIELPEIPDFKISFKPVYWLNDITLKISEYREFI